MSSAKDKTIIDFLCQIEKLFQDNATPFNQTYSAVFGYTAYSYLAKPEEVPLIYNAFVSINQSEIQQTLCALSRDQLFIKILSNPEGDIQKNLDQILSGKKEESKEAESKIPKEQIEKTAQLYEALASNIFDHLAFTEEESRLEPLDFTMWGFFCAQYDSKHSVTDILKKLLSVRQAQIAGVVNHNQKMRIFLKLFSNWDIDLNASFNKLLENPSLGSQPISSLAKEKGKPEDKLCHLCPEKISDKNDDVFTMDPCGHGFHTVCLSNHMLNLIKKRILILRCPAKNCQTEFGDSDLRELVKPHELASYYSYIEQEEKKIRDKNEIACQFCRAAGEEDDSNCHHKISRDGKEICFSCGLEWHAEIAERCKDYAELKNNSKQTSGTKSKVALKKK